MCFATRLAVSILVGLAVIFQIFPIISVPVTSTITLCTYNGFKFGVFGWCSTQSNFCSNLRVGYSAEYVELIAEDLSLPSRAKYPISKLLIVHPISLVFTAILWCFTLFIHGARFGHSRKVLFMVVLWSIPTFLLSLLSFLVDILLFVPYLQWPGWLVLVSTILIAMSSSMICILRRTVSLKKYERIRNSDTIEMYSLQYGGSKDRKKEKKESVSLQIREHRNTSSTGEPDKPESSYRGATL